MCWSFGVEMNEHSERVDNRSEDERREELTEVLKKGVRG